MTRLGPMPLGETLDALGIELVILPEGNRLMNFDDKLAALSRTAEAMGLSVNAADFEVPHSHGGIPAACLVVTAHPTDAAALRKAMLKRMRG